MECNFLAHLGTWSWAKNLCAGTAVIILCTYTLICFVKLNKSISIANELRKYTDSSWPTHLARCIAAIYCVNYVDTYDEAVASKTAHVAQLYIQW